MTGIVRTYSGKGTIRTHFCPGVPCSFDIVLHGDGEIDVRCECPHTPDALKILQEDRKGPLVYVAIFGTLLDGRQVKIRKAYLGNTTLSTGLTYDFSSTSRVEIGVLRRIPGQSIEIHCGLANLVFAGCQVSQMDNTVARDYFDSVLDGYTFRFKHMRDYDQIFKDLESNGGASVTTEIVFSCPTDNLSKAEVVMHDALTLLSFATGVWIGPVYEEIYVDGKLAMSKLLRSKIFSYRPTDHVIDIDNFSKCDVKEFLEATYLPFKRYKKSLGLGGVIEYYAHAKQLNYLTTKFLIASVALECLHSYARQHFGQTGEWRRQNRFWCFISRGLLGRKVSFPRQFVRLLRHFNVKYEAEELTRLYKIRNKIVHEGVLPAKIDGLNEYRRLINFTDRILLTILGYEGKQFLNCARSYARETLVLASN